MDGDGAPADNSWMIPIGAVGGAGTSTSPRKPTRLASPPLRAPDAVGEEQRMVAPGRSVTIEQEILPSSQQASKRAGSVPQHEVAISSREDSLADVDSIVPDFK